MGLKPFLILMTVVSVVSDSMLHPFYPQYFQEIFGVEDARHVGFYIGACSLTVMLSFPVWALLSRKIHVLPLLIATQAATGILSVICFSIKSLTWFWVVSLAMMVFKASYLLIYPYVMSLEEKEYHVGTISLLAFVVHFGNIFAALMAGVVFELIDARYLFIAMACGDVLQIALCLAIRRLPSPGVDVGDESQGKESGSGAKSPEEKAQSGPMRFFIRRLGAVMMLMYFSAYLTEPFFSAYWEGLAANGNKILSGIVFAIPGAAALLGLVYNARKRDEDQTPFAGILPSILAAILGLWLQTLGSPAALVAGRFAYGLALFQCMVRLDALLFRFSSPAAYSVDFSKINMFQALGIQAASLAAGSLVSAFGTGATFTLAMGGFAFGALLFIWLFRATLRPGAKAVSQPAAVAAKEALS